ncbi:hypothetical protein HY570_00790 [Candidatus Micrarchaeota archaeon]|nr:hypothetical protein [Candidatus Micrarchaeota archaeon]
MKKIVFVLFVFGILVLAGCIYKSGGALTTTPTSLTAEEVRNLNLKQSDVPPGYKLNKNYSRFTADANVYTEGNETDANRLLNYGWAATDEVYYETFDENNNTLNSIYVALSIYKNETNMDCALKQNYFAFKDVGAIPVPQNRVYGHDSIYFVQPYEDSVLGKIPLYQIRFYYGNVYANVEVGGPAESVKIEDAVKYAELIEKRLKDACPKCAKAPECERKIG